MILGGLFKQALFLAHEGLLLQFPDTILFMIPTPIREGDVATPPKINPGRLLKLFRGRMSGEFVGDIHTLSCFLLSHCEPGSQSEKVRGVVSWTGLRHRGLGGQDQPRHICRQLVLA